MENKKRNFETFQILDGLDLNDDFIELHEFSLMRYAYWESIIYPKITDEQKSIFGLVINELDKTKVVLKINILAKEYEEAAEKARLLSQRFEYLISYIIANLNFIYSIGTKDIRRTQVSSVITIDERGIGLGNKTHNFHKNYNLDKNIVFSNELGYNYLWKIISKNNLNSFQKRIIVSIEWIGKALWERDNTKSFFQIIIALESLLQFQPKSIISSSVANQISEWGAYISNDNYDQRIKIYKAIKELYTLRSKIVHSGSNSATFDDLYNALSTVKNIIISLTTKQEYMALENIEQLNDLINQKKFN